MTPRGPFTPLLLLFTACASAPTARQHPVYAVLAPWSGDVLESAEITYRGTTASMVGPRPRLVAMSRWNLLLREDVRFDRDVPNLLPTEGELVIGLNARSQSEVDVTIRLQGTSFCVNHAPLWKNRDGVVEGTVKAILPNENQFLKARLMFDDSEQKGRWDLVTGDGTLNIRLVFRAGRPEDGPVPRYLTQAEARSIRRQNQRETEPHCAE